MLGSIAAAPTIKVLRFPPKDFLILFLTKNLKTGGILSKKCLPLLKYFAGKVFCKVLTIFLCMFSNNKGTQITNDGLYSLMFLLIYLSPSQYVTVPPPYNGNKCPRVHSYVWWIGRIESTTVDLSTLTIWATDIIFEQIFLWDKQIPFAFPVVPEVKSNTCISSGFILISLNAVLPVAIFLAPSSNNLLNFKESSMLEEESIFINKTLFFNFSLLSRILFKYFSSHITAFASEIFIKLIMSSTWSSLSIGTTVPIIELARYEMIQE